MGRRVRMWRVRVEKKLDRVLAALDLIQKREEVMSAELETLKGEVARSTEVQQSAIVLINGLANKIMELKDDPNALTQLANSLRTKGGELADAVTTNTSAADSVPSAPTAPAAPAAQHGKNKK